MGWQVAKILNLSAEVPWATLRAKWRCSCVRKLAESIALEGGTVAQLPDFKRQLQETEVQLEAIQYTEFRLMASLSKGKGQNPGPESSVMKALSAQIRENQRTCSASSRALRQCASTPGTHRGQ